MWRPRPASKNNAISVSQRISSKVKTNLWFSPNVTMLKVWTILSCCLYLASCRELVKRDDGYGDDGASVDILGPLVLLAPLVGLLALFAAAVINSTNALVTIATLTTGRKKRDLSDGVERVMSIQEAKVKYD